MAVWGSGTAWGVGTWSAFPVVAPPSVVILIATLEDLSGVVGSLINFDNAPSADLADNPLIGFLKDL